ncbi:YbaY family lipoprotein [Pararhizobium gei]|uniref:YbaY family lipoprotein n=1 Tax=Pararhizobium gei TaxID=1395951 RepID=UPI0023DC7A24|nr:YbaY family lipoprotein [Rhizobium gei]
MTIVDILGMVELAQGPVAEGLDVRVRFEDTTMMDGPSIVIAETMVRLAPGAAASARFRLAVPAGRLDTRRHYTLSARGRRAGSSDFRDFGTVQSYSWRAGVDTLYHLTIETFTGDQQNPSELRPSE